jgi:hypothetical protein
MRFGIVFKHWILYRVQCFSGSWRIQHENCTLALVFDEARLYRLKL